MPPAFSKGRRPIMQFAKTIPLNEIRKIQIYHNSLGYHESEMETILRSTGGSFLFGGPIFLSNLTACCHLKAEGHVECDPKYTVDIIQWNEDVQDYGMGKTPSAAENYVECVALIVNGTGVAQPHYQPDMGGKRPRQAIGCKEGRFAYIVTETSYTPEGLRDVLVSSGWDGAIMLDGGGSVCYLDRDGNRIMCDADRVLPYYFVVFLKEDKVQMNGTAANVLSIAEKEVGYKESPSGSNKTKYGKWYGLDGYAWCVMFVQWVFAQAGVSLPARTASCTVLRNYAKKAGQWVISGYQPGDIVIYDWGSDSIPDHCGIVQSVGSTTLKAIEGNTAIGNDSNGGEVMVRERKISQVMGAVRPAYEKETDKNEEKDTMVRYERLSDIKSATFRTIIEKLMNAGIIQGDGSDATGNNDVIDLSHDQVRLLVFAYRGGAFDAKLKAAGLEPAVQ